LSASAIEPDMSSSTGSAEASSVRRSFVHPKAQRDQMLAGGIVQLDGDALALFVLDRQQPLRGFPERRLGARDLGDVLMQDDQAQGVAMLEAVDPQAPPAHALGVVRT
jgi:hypothetical protein